MDMYKNRILYVDVVLTMDTCPHFVAIIDMVFSESYAHTSCPVLSVCLPVRPCDPSGGGGAEKKVHSCELVRVFTV